jgi:hypothetical protein
MSRADQLEGAAPPLAQSESAGQEGSATRQLESAPVQRKYTGPRTQLGKQRTRYNAVKHGLFAKVVLLSHEPRSEFNALLYGLHESLKPQGVLEQTLVEKLATVLWRYRRLLQAESAEVLKNIEGWRSEKNEASDKKAEFEYRVNSYLAKTSREGLIAKIDDPKNLQTCLEHLRDARNEAGERGLGYEEQDYGQDFCLALIYGIRYEGRPGRDLYNCFLECREAQNATPADRQKRGFLSQGACVEKFIEEADKEIHRLSSLQESVLPKARVPTKVRHEDAGLLKSAIPVSSELDRLLRYEVTVERALDRTLAQLERLQQVRFERETIDIAGPVISDQKSFSDKPADL